MLLLFFKKLFMEMLDEFTRCTQIAYDEELGGLLFQLYSQRQKQLVSIRVECDKKEVTKKFVKENLKRLQDMIETDISK